MVVSAFRLETITSSGKDFLAVAQLAGHGPAMEQLLRSVEECVPICIKASHSRFPPAVSSTPEVLHKGAPGEIKLSKSEPEPQRTAAPVQFG
jgi:hypothetical protein